MEISNNLSRGYSVTEFGTELNTVGKIARFYDMERDSRVRAVAAKVLASLVLGLTATPVIGGILVCTHLSGIPLFVASIVTFLAFYVMIEIFKSFSYALSCQRKERAVIEAVGGYEVFNSLPTLPKDQVQNGHTSYLDTITPEQLNYKPITKGTDKGNRPFISFYCSVENEGESVDTLFQRYPTDSIWTVAHSHLGNKGKQRPLFERSWTFEEMLEKIRQISRNGSNYSIPLIA